MVADYLFELALFACKCILVLLVIACIISLIFSQARRGRGQAAGREAQPRLVIKNLSRELKKQRREMRRALDKADPDKQLCKQEQDLQRRGFFAFLHRKKKNKARIQAQTVNQADAGAVVVPMDEEPVKTETAGAGNKEDLNSVASAAAQPAENSTSLRELQKADAEKVQSAVTEPACNKDSKDKQSKDQRQLNKRKEKRQQQLLRLHQLEQEGVFCPRHVFVLNFNGSPSGNEVKKLRREIDALLTVACERDEVVVKLTSPGGMVNSYGLLSSQLLRIRKRGIYLTACVDSVAASGGYLMACVANKIVAAPFAYIGSIGVVAEFLNFNRLLNSHEVDYEQVTAGKYKRTLTMLGPNTDEGRAKFKQELEAIHQRFKEQVLTYRPQLDADKVATGEHWLALDAKELGLVDEIATSEEYLAQRAEQTYGSVLQISLVRPKKRGFKALLNRMSLLKLLGLEKSQLLQQKLERTDPLDSIR